MRVGASRLTSPAHEVDHEIDRRGSSSPAQGSAGAVCSGAGDRGRQQTVGVTARRCAAAKACRCMGNGRGRRDRGRGRGSRATCTYAAARAWHRAGCHETRVHAARGAGEVPWQRPYRARGEGRAARPPSAGRAAYPASASTHRRVRSCALARGTGELQGCPFTPHRVQQRFGLAHRAAPGGPRQPPGRWRWSEHPEAQNRPRQRALRLG